MKMLKFLEITQFIWKRFGFILKSYKQHHINATKYYFHHPKLKWMWTFVIFDLELML